MPVSFLIVDDHDVFRSRARAVVQAAGYDVIGEADDAGSVIGKVRALRPDVVLLDIQLPDGDGISLADQIAQETDAPTVVLISSRERVDFGASIDRSAAVGFINKLDLSRASLEALLGQAG